MSDYEKLMVWRKAHTFACEIFRLCRTLPADDAYVFRDQLRRAAVSIGSNIAEGCARSSDGLFKQHLATSLGSANEVHYLLLVARDVGSIDAEHADALRLQADEIRRMLGGLISAVKRRLAPKLHPSQRPA